MSLIIVFILANSVHPDEMPQCAYAAFHLSILLLAKVPGYWYPD